jgi:hypothetical protein
MPARAGPMTPPCNRSFCDINAVIIGTTSKGAAGAREYSSAARPLPRRCQHMRRTRRQQPCRKSKWRVKPVDKMLPNLRLGDDLIDLMKGFGLSSAEAIGGAWEARTIPVLPTPSPGAMGDGVITLGPARTDCLGTNMTRPPLDARRRNDRMRREFHHAAVVAGATGRPGLSLGNGTGLPDPRQ